MKSFQWIPLILVVISYSCGTGSDPTYSITYDSLEYNIYFGDTQAGYQTSWQEPNGDYRFLFEFNDRGRGPYFEEVIRLNDQKVITYQQVLGHNYLKDTVSEVFEVIGSQANWTSTSETGFAEFGGGSHYSAINGSFGGTEMLIRKLLETESGEIPLLPSGKARISNITTHNIGDSLDLRLVSITGFSFTPTYVWIDNNNRFFASTNNWFACIKKGFDNLSPTLQEIVKNAEDDYFKRNARTLIDVPAAEVAFTNVNIFDPVTRTIKDDQVVVIKDSKIIKIAGELPHEMLESVRIIDGKGQTLLPGLFDMHVHIDKTDGILQLAAGVTSVRDLANSLDLPELKEKFDNDELVGPRIVSMAGFIDKAGPYAGPTGKIISSLEEGLEAVEFYKSNGYDQIKLYSSIEPQWVKPLADRAHKLGMRISGHIPSFSTASQAVENGYDEIQHVNMLILNFLSDTIDTRTPLRFSMVAEYGYAVDTKSKEFKNFVNLLKRKKTILDPTVSIFENMITTPAGEPDPTFSMILERLPVQVKRGFYSGGLPIPDGKQQQYKDSYAKMLEIVMVMYENEIHIVPGTDAMAGFALHRELENYVRAGIPPGDVLYFATLGSAKVVAKEKELGSVEVGKMADFILVDGNPLTNISDIRRVTMTVKDGKIFDPGKLYASIGVSDFE